MTYIRKREEILNKFKVLMKEITGKNISDEEIIEKCLNYSIEHIKELLLEKSEVLDLNNDLKKKILSGAQNSELYHLDKTDDELIYGI